MAQMIGLGRVGRDVELRHTPQGDQVANVSLAFAYGKRDPNTGNRPAQWVDATLWGQRAESLAPHLLKGTLLHVTIDDPHIETFQRQDGTQGSKLVGRISNLEFASRPPESAAQSTQAQQHRPQTPQRPPQNDYQATRNGQQSAASAPAGGFQDMDDDIPW